MPQLFQRESPGNTPKKRKEKIKRRTCEKQLETLMVRRVKLAKSYHTYFHVLCQMPKKFARDRTFPRIDACHSSSALKNR